MRNTCTIKECAEPVVGNGLCRKHYMRWRRTGSTELAERAKEQCREDCCTEMAKARGLCERHYKRERANQLGRATINPSKARGPILGRACEHCGSEIPSERRPQTRYCSEACSHRASTKRYAERNPEKMRRIARASQRKRKYGISTVEYEERLATQGGVCAICGAEPPGEGRFPNLDVDHDHATSELRGLLCRPCNQMLSRAGDDPDLLDAAAAYLRG